jgi:hypothetical protein
MPSSEMGKQTGNRMTMKLDHLFSMKLNKPTRSILLSGDYGSQEAESPCYPFELSLGILAMP